MAKGNTENYTADQLIKALSTDSEFNDELTEHAKNKVKNWENFSSAAFIKKVMNEIVPKGSKMSITDDLNLSELKNVMINGRGLRGKNKIQSNYPQGKVVDELELASINKEKSSKIKLNEPQKKTLKEDVIVNQGGKKFKIPFAGSGKPEGEINLDKQKASVNSSPAADQKVIYTSTPAEELKTDPNHSLPHYTMPVKSAKEVNSTVVYAEPESFISTNSNDLSLDATEEKPRSGFQKAISFIRNLLVGTKLGNFLGIKDTASIAVEDPISSISSGNNTHARYADPNADESPYSHLNLETTLSEEERDYAVIKAELRAMGVKTEKIDSNESYSKLEFNDAQEAAGRVIPKGSGEVKYSVVEAAIRTSEANDDSTPEGP